MEFCNNCKNYLFLKEEKYNNQRTLFYYCKNCEFKKECLDNKILFKRYNFDDEKIEDNNYINKYKVHDITLHKKNTKCPKCNQIKKNTYEVKYLNNSYNLNFICSKCFHSWIY
jgi:DNA-directed RNA polymerase subunit M/transcription elongation factor TFIIS